MHSMDSAALIRAGYRRTDLSDKGAEVPDSVEYSWA
jgi:hypothetical protein